MSPQKSQPRGRGHGAKTQAVRDRVIAALVGSSSLRAAAHAAAVDEGTVRRWLRDDPAFVTAYRNARARVLDETLGDLIDAGGSAVQTLRDCLGAESESVRVSAARAVLEHLSRSHDDQELADRVARLTELAEQLGVKV